MTTFERALDCLRPLIKTKAWDYCIIWQLGDDPSRFIQWRACCCSGGYSDSIKVKEESVGEQQIKVLCKDAYYQHPAITDACKELAQFPSSIALYSGVHGEAVISGQPQWLVHANTSNPEKKIGTQVLVPFPGSIIELFTTKHVPRDQKLLDLISTLSDISQEPETMKAQNHEWNLSEKRCYEILDDYSYKEHKSKFQLGGRFVLPESQTITSLSLEGSSVSSNYSISDKQPVLELGQISKDESPENSNGNVKFTEEQDADVAAMCANHGASSGGAKAKQNTERENYQSKNLLTERRRRKRINDGLLSLRALVPNITKMDKAATLGDAYDYIQELEQCIKDYRDELRAMAEEDCKKMKAASRLPISNKKVGEKRHSKSHANVGKQPEEEIDVSATGTREFLLKIICKQRRGGFSRLMEAAHSLGLQVIDVNVTTLNGMVLNILKVEANRKNVQANRIKDSLTELIVDVPKQEVGSTKRR